MHWQACMGGQVGVEMHWHTCIGGHHKLVDTSCHLLDMHWLTCIVRHAFIDVGWRHWYTLVAIVSHAVTDMHC